MSGDSRSGIRIASTGVIKAGIALGLMAVFFICFFLAPGPTVAVALVVVLAIELFRRR